jgi:hypothetical protein
MKGGGLEQELYGNTTKYGGQHRERKEIKEELNKPNYR